MSAANLLQQLVNKLTKLGDKLHLNREQSYIQLQNSILPEILRNGLGQSELENTARQIIIDVAKIMYNSKRWEDRYGAINASILLVSNFYPVSNDEEKAIVDSALSDFVWNTIRIEKIPFLIVDEEFRVRNQVGPLLKEMISKDIRKGAQHFEKLKEALLKNIEETFTREPDAKNQQSDNSFQIQQTQGQLTFKKDDQGKVIPEYEGWRSLETSLRILQNIIEALGTKLYEFDLKRIEKCLKQGTQHINRFVREISHFVINAIYISSANIYQQDNQSNIELFEEISFELVQMIKQGLEDNWSQVRYSASLAVRSFYLIIKDQQNLRNKFDSILIPRMCLNRYYSAEGVKIYSQETWKIIFEENGKQLLINYSDKVSEYYINQLSAPNDCVREAACYCIDELCKKVACEIDKNSFSPYVSQMLNSLIQCFKDASWQVRDGASIATAQFIVTFPEQSETHYQSMCEIWFDNLGDNVLSVRENTARSLAIILKSDYYRDKMMEQVKNFLKENLMMVKNQEFDKKDKHKVNCEDDECNEDNTDKDHINGVVFSCCNYTPSLNTGNGCMDHGTTKSKEPWEITDGLIFLLKEVSYIDYMHFLILDNIENLSQIAKIDYFKHSHSLRENLFNNLQVIVQNLGKKQFRDYVEIVLDSSFKNSRNQEFQNMAISAQKFILILDNIYGQGIFKAIVENHNKNFVEDLEKYREEGKKRQQVDSHGQMKISMSNLGMGLGSGSGAVAGALNTNHIPSDLLLTKAPWAK